MHIVGGGKGGGVGGDLDMEGGGAANGIQA